MRTELQSNPEIRQVDGFMDQYQRPSCRPLHSTEELREVLGPGTTQLLQVLNRL